MDLEQAQQLVKGRLSEKRYQHTLNVRDQAVHLAHKYGADEKKAALAALLHDAAKELPRQELLQILKDNAIMAGNAQEHPVPVWHGPCAAILCKTQWGVDDPEVLSAIDCHTTGKPGMSKLDKIIYLADMTSAERSYPEVYELRELAEEDLDKAMLVALGKNLEWMEQSGKPIDPLSRETYDDLRRLYHGGKE